MNLRIKALIDKYSILIFCLFLAPLILKSLEKITSIKFLIFFKNIVGIYLSLIIFLFMLLTSRGFIYFFKLKTNYSFSYVLFFLSTFFVANCFAIFEIMIKFEYFIIFILLILNLSFFIYEEKMFNKIFQLFFIFNILLINLNFKILNFFQYSELRSEQSGDVEKIIPIIRKIFENNILSVFQNPITDAGFVHINFTIFGHYYFSFLSKSLNLLNEFLVLNFLPYTLFFLSLLFFFELKISIKIKFLIIFLNINILIINPWIFYLLINSYMVEGVTAIFFAIIFYNLYFENFKLHKNSLLIYVILGYFIFSKFFVNILVIIFFIIYKKKSYFEKLLISLGSINLFYLMFYRYSSTNANKLINKINTKIISDIFRYWIEDSIWIYCSLFGILFFIINKFINLNKAKFNTTILQINLLNIIFILLLYSISWTEGVEYESSYRYMLQTYYLNIVFLFTTLQREIN